MGKPRWCYNGELSNGVPARVWDQECFPGLSGEYKIDTINYFVGETLNNPKSPMIEVYLYENSGPAEEAFFTVPLGEDDIKKGEHEIDITMPNVQAPFCVGITGGSIGSLSGLGIAVDSTEPAPGMSFWGMGGPPPTCEISKFTDILDTGTSSPGHWCIGFSAVKINEP